MRCRKGIQAYKDYRTVAAGFSDVGPRIVQWCQDLGAKKQSLALHFASPGSDGSVSWHVDASNFTSLHPSVTAITDSTGNLVCSLAVGLLL